MKTLHAITLSVFIKPEEDYEKNKDAFLSFFPFDLEEQKIQIKQSSAISFEERKIIVLEVQLTKTKHCDDFLISLLGKLFSEQKQMLLRQKESRLDENCCFFMRFDKERLLEKKELFITDSGNCFHLKICIACYPAKREKAFPVIEGFFKT